MIAKECKINTFSESQRYKIYSTQSHKNSVFSPFIIAFVV